MKSLAFVKISVLAFFWHFYRSRYKWFSKVITSSYHMATYG